MLIGVRIVINSTQDIVKQDGHRGEQKEFGTGEQTMRDRLIELINKAKCEYANDITDHTETDYIVEALLNEGAILPPCKVGDKVYKISRNKVKECEVVFIGLSADEKCSHFNFVENYADGTFYKSYSMVFDVIGKTVFLTKEEAEAKLKERNK